MSRTTNSHVGRSALSRTILAGMAALFPQILPAAGAEDLTLRRSIVPSTLPATGAIRFPGADTLTVAFRSLPKEPVPAAASEDYSALQISAEKGDAAAASIFGALLIRCAMAMGAPHAVDEGQKSVRRLPKNVPIRSNAALGEFCAQLTMDEMATAMDWAKKGAADLESMNRLAGLYLPGTDEQLEVFTAMWQQGSIIALHKLAVAYRIRSEGPNAKDRDAEMSLASA